MPILKFLASKRISRYIKLSFFLWDLILLNSAHILSFYLREGDLHRLQGQEQQTIFLLSNIVWFSLVIYFNTYKIIRIERIGTTVIRTIQVVLTHLGCVALFIVILKYHDISRLRMLYFYLTFFLFLLIFRIVFIKMLKFARSIGYNFKNVVIVGANPLGAKIAAILSKDLSLGYKVIGFFDDVKDRNIKLSSPILSDFKGIENYILTHKIDEMYIALHINDLDEISRLIKLCERNMIRMKFIPDFQQYTKTKKVVIDFYENTPVLMLRKEPLELPINRLLKKMFDVCFSLLVVVTIFPWLFPILMVIIKIGSRGPIFFKQKRSGEENKSFTCLKFRTMRVNKLSDELQATENDPRITRIGSFLRKTNLDELPQFFNVLWGSMSVVGPRPHMLKHTEQYSAIINDYLVRHYAKPGITGWAQVKGFRGETKEIIDMEKRVEHDIWYIENWNFVLDLQIILLTIRNMLKGEEKAN
jgi:undecaprenyl-phosphate galactose phosphotransferase/putative colanic acid biosynthesis UDP-glucose lipid carrier transferase